MRDCIDCALLQHRAEQFYYITGMSVLLRLWKKNKKNKVDSSAGSCDLPLPVPICPFLPLSTANYSWSILKHILTKQEKEI